MPSFNIINNINEITLNNEWVPTTKFNNRDKHNEKGRRVNSDYKGRLYRIIDKRIRTLTCLERFGRGFLGMVVIVCTLGLGIFFKSVRTLCCNSKVKVRFGVREYPSNSVLEHVGHGVKSNYDTVLREVRQNPLALQYASASLRDNSVVVGEAVKNNGLALEYAGKDLKNNIDIVKRAVQQNPLALQYASASLRDNSVVVGEAVKINGLALEHAGFIVRGNKDIVMRAVRQNPLALQYASDRLQNCFDIVAEAVKNNGLALEYAGKNLKNHYDLVKVAVQQNPLALQYASASLRDRSELVFYAQV